MTYKKYRRLGIAIAALLAASHPAAAHHSFAMFDQGNQVEVQGAVEDYKFVAPHSYIILDVKAKDGTTESWILEGGSPSQLARDGWSKTSLKPGDEIKARIAPLRSGAPGGAWVPERTQFLDGRPIAEKPEQPVPPAAAAEK